LFCGKFTPKKRPRDVVEAVRHLRRSGHPANLHLLFVGSGELVDVLRSECAVISDNEYGNTARSNIAADSSRPPASFTGFLNQSEICKAYVAADCLVLPSDYGETWGLVANEAMAAGLPCILSDRCGAALDLGKLPLNRVFRCGDFLNLSAQIAVVYASGGCGGAPPKWRGESSFDETVSTAVTLYNSTVNS